MLLAGMLLAGCVTVEPVVGNVDIDKAVSTHIKAGMEYLRQRKPQDASRHFVKALELNKKSAEAHNAMALLYRYERDEEREEYHYKKALRADSEFAPAQNNYGIFLARKNRDKEALEHFTVAANKQGYENRAIAYENIGAISLKRGDESAAIDAYTKALRLRPENMTPALELAQLYFRRGEIKTADFYYSNFARQVTTQSARGLWLGIQIAAELKQSDRVASYELALKNLYPGSEEFKAWQKWRGGNS